MSLATCKYADVQEYSVFFDIAFPITVNMLIHNSPPMEFGWRFSGRFYLTKISFTAMNQLYLASDFTISCLTARRCSIVVSGNRQILPKKFNACFYRYGTTENIYCMVSCVNDNKNIILVKLLPFHISGLVIHTSA